jgi:hypothetical protein
MSIEKFKSTYKEFSRQNRFEVYIPGFPPETTMACLSATLPGLGFATAPGRWFSEGVTAVPYESPYDITDNPINLIFLVDSECSIMKPITAWMDEVYDQERGFGYLDTYGRQVEIYQLNRHGDRVFGIKLDKAWPKNFGDLSFASSDGAPTTVSLSLTYGKFWYI